jgi:hypothetical protein
MPKKKRMLTGVGLAAGLVAGGAGFLMEMAGSAGASSASATTTAASAPGDPSAPVTPAAGTGTPGTGTAGDTAKPDRTARLKETLQSLIDDGTLSQAQVDAVIAKIEAAMPAGGPVGTGRDRGGRGGADLDLVATTLGITAGDVRTAVRGGQTIAELAVAKGKTAQDVIDALVADAKTRLNARVTAGTITQAEADTRLTAQTTRLTDFVNSTKVGPEDGHGPGEGHGPGGREGRPWTERTRTGSTGTGSTPATTPSTTPA